MTYNYLLANPFDRPDVIINDKIIQSFSYVSACTVLYVHQFNGFGRTVIALSYNINAAISLIIAITHNIIFEAITREVISSRGVNSPNR